MAIVQHNFQQRVAICAILFLFLLTFSAIGNAHAQTPTQVFFSSCPTPGTVEPIGHVYPLFVQGTDSFGVASLGVFDITTNGPVIGWSAQGCGPGAIHEFTVVNEGQPPSGWSGFLWEAEMQQCVDIGFWFSTYSTAGLYPT